MNITSNALLPLKSFRETDSPVVTSGRWNSGATRPSSTMVEGVAAIPYDTEDDARNNRGTARSECHKRKNGGKCHKELVFCSWHFSTCGILTFLFFPVSAEHGHMHRAGDFPRAGHHDAAK